MPGPTIAAILEPMEARSHWTHDARIRGLAVLLPYAAVLGGLYLMQSAWLTLLGYHVGAVLLLTRTRGRHVWREAVRGWPPVPAAGLAVLCTLAGICIWWLWPRIHLPGLDLDTGLAGWGLHGGGWLTFIVYFGTVHPVIEEALWRGVVGPRDRVRPAATDLLFAGYHALVLSRFIHLAWAVVAVALIALAAWGWRLCARRWEGLGVPIAGHAAADLSVMLAVHFLRQS